MKSYAAILLLSCAAGAGAAFAAPEGPPAPSDIQGPVAIVDDDPETTASSPAALERRSGSGVVDPSVLGTTIGAPGAGAPDEAKPDDDDETTRSLVTTPLETDVP